MDKYSWSFDRDGERWNQGADTIEDCIDDARAEAKDPYCEDQPTVVYIGETVAFEPSVCAYLVFDDLVEQAYDFCGEIGGDWRVFDTKKPDEISELGVEITATVKRWLKKYGYEPTFYRVEGVKEYPLFEEVQNG